MKKMAKVAALLAAMVLAAGLTACKEKDSTKELFILLDVVVGYKPDVSAKLSIPKGIVGIGGEAFKECLKLESVTIPDTVLGILNNAFYGCENLKSVTIGKGLVNIDNYAFYGCKNLKSVNIPASVTEIGYSAFYGCESLKEVKYAGTKAQWEEIKSSYGIGNFVVHCKDGDVTETLEE